MKIDEAIPILIDKMFEIAGYDIGYKDIVGRKDDWFSQYTMTEDQCTEWINWCVGYLYRKRIFRSKDVAQKEMSWFNLAYGLKIK